MVNVDLVCQIVPKEPLQARVSKGAVATAITACGFVTFYTYYETEEGDELQQRLPLAVL